MLIALSIFEVIFTILVGLSISMLENKFKRVRACIKVYGSKRNYKTKADMLLIDKILDECRGVSMRPDRMDNIRCLILKNLQKEYIGRFEYISIMNIATRLSGKMWWIIGVQLLIVFINQMSLKEPQTFILLTISFLLTIVTVLYSLIKTPDKKENILVNEMMNYVVGIYEKKEKEQAQEIYQQADTRRKIQEKYSNQLSEREDEIYTGGEQGYLEENLSDENEIRNKKNYKNRLSEKDIASMVATFYNKIE